MNRYMTDLTTAMAELTTSMNGQMAALLTFNKQVGKRGSEIDAAMRLPQSIRLLKRDQIQREMARDLDALATNLKTQFASQDANTVLFEQSALHVPAALDYSTPLAQKESSAFLAQMKSTIKTANEAIDSMTSLGTTVKSLADLSPEIAIACEDLSATLSRATTVYGRQAKACENILQMA